MLLKSLRLSPPTAGAQMVRAAGQGQQGLGLGLGAPRSRVWWAQAWSECQAWAGRPGAWGPGPGAWGPGPQGLGARAPERLPNPKRNQFFVVLKSLLVGGWRRGGSQLNNHDETRSDHGPVGNILTIETESSEKPQEIKRCKKCQDHHAGQPVGST